jgi:hypothetical protein
MKKSATAHKACTTGSGRSELARSALAAFALWTAAGGVAAAESGATAMTCTNPYSGASWQIHIDYDRSTVDSNRALISDAEISWRDPAGRKYLLDRKSGDLTVTLASATGGNFLYDQCKPEH